MVLPGRSSSCSRARTVPRSVPFVRKRMPRGEGLGSAYEALFELQQAGRRFRHLPRILDCYRTSDELIVVSEYIEGATLEELVRHDGGGLASAGVTFPAVCDAVAELHGVATPPIIHRDVKPANIIVSNTPDGITATLIDFGIARRYREGTGADTVRFGTRAYAPPEQFGFGQTDVRSDVYALGMVLLFCLTGEGTRRAANRRDAGSSGDCIRYRCNRAEGDGIRPCGALRRRPRTQGGVLRGGICGRKR